jgi:hypothetical protein
MTTNKARSFLFASTPSLPSFIPFFFLVFFDQTNLSTPWIWGKRSTDPRKSSTAISLCPKLLGLGVKLNYVTITASTQTCFRSFLNPGLSPV